MAYRESSNARDDDQVIEFLTAVCFLGAPRVRQTHHYWDPTFAIRTYHLTHVEIKGNREAIESSIDISVARGDRMETVVLTGPLVTFTSRLVHV